MSGHSKWSTIKRKKEKTDNARAKIFTKIGRELAVAVKEGGADPDNNSKLKECIAKAKANNVPLKYWNKLQHGESCLDVEKNITYTWSIIPDTEVNLLMFLLLPPFP